MGACIDNIDYDINNHFGELFWGDGVIRHGHYIGFLATEYKLLKNNGKDVTQVLNELYYALKAFNRLDYSAEEIMSDERNNLSHQNPNLNGFYVRDDVPKDFDDYWENEPIQARGVYASHYSNNNAAHINDPSGDYYAEHTHDFGWDEPSLDQMSSMLVGLTVCHKLLEDNLWVQPTANDPGVNLKNEVAQITHRIIDYANQHNWQLLNIYGWPVVNGGGELVITAFPISVIGHHITGLNYVNPIYRQINQGGNVILSKFHKEDNPIDAILIASQLTPLQANKYDNINNNFLDFYPNGHSNFEQWQLYGLGGIPYNISYDFWTQASYFYPSFSDDWNDNHKFNMFPFPLNKIKFDDLNLFKDYNNTILMNLGVSSGLFTKNVTKLWENETHHHQLSLIQALLTGNVPVNSQQFYKELLDSYPVYGAFKYKADNIDYSTSPATPATIEQYVYPTNWGGEYRWTHYGESTTDTLGNQGQYTGLDYMYLHNLYKLVFPNNQPVFEEKYSCICEVIDNNDLQISNIYHGHIGQYTWGPNGIILQDYPPNIHIINPNIHTTGFPPPLGGSIIYSYLTQSEYDAIQAELAQNNGLLNGNAWQINNLESCVPNDFIDLGNALHTQYTMGMLHDNYEAMKIYTNNYQTEMFTVQNAGQLDVRSRVIVCEDQTLNIESGGKVRLLSGEIRVNENATILISGELYIGNHQKLILEEGAKAVILPGGVLNNNGEVIVNNNAKIEYHKDAQIKMFQNYSEINFNGGDLYIKDYAVFKILHGNTAAGHLRFTSWGEHIFCGVGSLFILSGVGQNNDILIIDKDADFWSANNSNYKLMRIYLKNGKVVLHKNARFVSTSDYFRAVNINFSNDYANLQNNRGVVTFSSTVLRNCTFNKVRLSSINYYKPMAYLFAANTTFNCTDGYQPDGTGFKNAIEIKGKYYGLKECVLNTEDKTTVYSQNLNFTSKVRNTVFNTLGNSDCKVYDNSNVMLYLKNNTFNDSYVALNKTYGSTALRCNTFNNCYNALSINYHTNLNMSTWGLDYGNGYNKFNGTTHNDIKFNYASAPTIKLGYNEFSKNIPNGKTFEGYAYVYDAGIGAVVLASNNAWGGQALPAPQTNFNVFSPYTNGNVNFNTLNPTLSYCGEYDNVTPPGNPGDGSSSSKSANPSIILEGYNEVKKPLNQLVREALVLSEVYDSTANNLEAIDLFHKIIMYDYTSIKGVKLDRIAYTLNFAYFQMKYALHDAFVKDEINIIKNKKTLSPYVVKFIDVLNKRSSFIRLINEKEEVFFHEIEKVEFLRIFGKYDLALGILNNIEFCSTLDYVEQEALNDFKFNLLEEKASIAYGYKASLIDTVFTDTNTFVRPIHVNDVISYGFGSIINDLNSVSYINDCNNRMANTDENTRDVLLTVFPNPSNNVVNFDVFIENDMSGYLNIYSLDGKILKTIYLSNGHNFKQIKFNEYDPGVYYYNLVIDEKIVKNGKVIIQH